MKNTSMRHSEGGWPKDVDFTEQSDVTRFRKKAEKDESYQEAMKTLGPIAERCINQNNTVDVYSQYFEDTQDNHCLEPPSAKGLAVFRDPSPVKRSATSINWHPEINSSKLAVSYSVMNFQDNRLADPQFPVSVSVFQGQCFPLNKSSFSQHYLSLHIQSYIWDITNSNKPLVELAPPSSLCCLRFNPKSTDTLVGGCHNGLITCFDLRKPNRPTGHCSSLETSVVEKSHHDPISDIFWVSSKTGHQCASVSTDGRMMWWDTRNLSEPIEVLLLNTETKDGGVLMGGSSLEYNTEAGPTKYLVGTEQGTVASVNLRNRKITNGVTVNNGVSVYDCGHGKHHGPVHSIQRNPTHNKFFMTIGDWTAKIWAEDLKTPIITTNYHSHYLTGGCWSPTRPGVFYVIGMDGSLNVWDFFHRQSELAYSHKVGNTALSSIGIQGNTQVGGKLVAVGDVNGSVSLLEVCNSLACPQQNEKGVINSMFERETRREKNLEVRDRELRRSRAQAKEREKKKAFEQENGMDEDTQEALDKIEADFDTMLKDCNSV
jgi:dynein intermediate chain 2